MSNSNMRNGVKRRGKSYSFVVSTPGADGKSKQVWCSKDQFGQTLRTRKAADDARALALTELANQTYVKPTATTVGGWLSEWIDSKSVSYARTTLGSYRDRIRLYLIPTFGTIPLRTLTTTQVNTGLARISKEGGMGGRPLDDKTVKAAHAVLHKALNDAELDRLISRNPATGASLPKSSGTRHDTVEVISADQLRAVLENLSTHRLYAAFYVAAYTGMRRGELCGLHWSDIDFETKRIIVGRNGVMVAREDGGEGRRKRERIVKRPKSEKLRIIPVSDSVLTVLKAHKAAQAAERLHAGELWRGGSEVFLSAFGDPIYPDTTTNLFSKAIRKIDLTTEQAKKPPSLKCLRHTHATLLLLAGIPVHVVADRLGHSSPTVTWSVYAHLLPGAGETAVEAFEKLLAS